MLVVFPPIFVAATKLIYGYNFVDPVMVILVNFIRSFPLINNLLINAEVVLADYSIMLPSISEKHKICFYHIKSLLIVN